MTERQRGNAVSSVEMDPATGGLLPKLPTIEGFSPTHPDDFLRPEVRERLYRDLQSISERRRLAETMRSNRKMASG